MNATGGDRMPGGRLTLDDRRRIADWLVEGVGYAEIGRRLGRPTSTVSREVARNGGPGGYRADGAQRAAGRRSPRRTTGPAGGVPAGTAEAVGTDSEQTRALLERLATALAATGLPRMPARVFTCLLTADTDSRTAAELVRLLRVSPASISKAIGYLEAMDLVGRRLDPSGRREQYFIDDDVWFRAWRSDTGAHAEVAEAARRGIELLGPGSAAAERLERMRGFFGRLSDHMGDGGVTAAVAGDALTMVAALVHAGAPRTEADLAQALGWEPDRAAAALGTLDRRPEIADPLQLVRTPAGAWTLGLRPERLTPAQREALHRAPRP
ncbi:helix-turn-helix domain-containing protein [Nonomuraea sp. NPDC050310]|uniref:GbsR/MarR family transcriptional regulator n=1 Tax=Nonomuraea sp. NPDC050310 TaxID=3154935 RepID=UPI0034042578